VLKEKDQQIQELTDQTNQYINEMEASAAVVEDLRAELSRGQCLTNRAPKTPANNDNGMAQNS
jgi:hypothetical protein